MTIKGPVQRPRSSATAPNWQELLIRLRQAAVDAGDLGQALGIGILKIASRLEAIASRLGAVALRVEAIALRVEPLLLEAKEKEKKEVRMASPYKSVRLDVSGSPLCLLLAIVQHSSTMGCIHLQTACPGFALGDLLISLWVYPLLGIILFQIP